MKSISELTQKDIKQLKTNKKILFIYTIPNSLQDQCILVSDGACPLSNCIHFSLVDWWRLSESGDLLPYICAVLPKKNKIKEYINLYQKPDFLLIRKNLQKNFDKWSPWYFYQQVNWALQLFQEGKINRTDVFKKTFESTEDMLASAKDLYNKYLVLTEDMYKTEIQKQHA